MMSDGIPPFAPDNLLCPKGQFEMLYVFDDNELGINLCRLQMSIS